MKLCILIASLLLSTSCFGRQTANNPGTTVQDVTYCQLATDPSAFVGKQIRIRAIYSYMFEVSSLKSPTCCPNRDLSIWVDFDEDLKGSSKRIYRKFPKGMGTALATFEGTFQGDGPYGAAGSPFRLTVRRIENLEAKGKPSLQHSPSWLPKECEASSASPLHQ
jgi:hypothetical protein